jgi:hypothetical protein
MPNKKASIEWQKMTGCPATVPIPVETDGGSGTACSHWDEYYLRGEVMSGYLSGGMELSRMTIGALEDLGYDVDYAGADNFNATNFNPECVKELCGDGGQRRLGAPPVTGKLDNMFEKPSR